MPNKHVEHDNQVEFFRRCSYQKYGEGTLRDYVFAVPNALPYGGKQAMLQMLRLRAEGLTKGIPDIECFIPIPPYTGLHIEMKKPRPEGKPSDVTPEQHQKMALLTSQQRKCVVAFGWEEAWRELRAYLSV
jgi:hypothetical protein